MLVVLSWIACAADPLVAVADPLVEIVPAPFAVTVQVDRDLAAAAVADLPPGTPCGFLVGPSDVLADATPVGEGRADDTGVASVAFPAGGGELPARVHAVCAVGAVLYAAAPVRM